MVTDGGLCGTKKGETAPGSQVLGLGMPLVQLVKQLQPAPLLTARYADPKPHFGVVFGQRPESSSISLFRL